MVVLVMLVPFYVFIAGAVEGRELHVPELALDRAIPIVPAWSIVYGALYLFLIVLPVLLIRQGAHIRTTALAFLTVWVIAYIVFLAYPTAAPRPEKYVGEGFGAWGLNILYGADPPFNCFPSLHVAHSFVSALACSRVHQRLGTFALIAASLVALSTLFTKQHYVVDVVAGIALALIAYRVFLRRIDPASIPEVERTLAPVLAVGTFAMSVCGVAAFWIAYRLTTAG